MYRGKAEILYCMPLDSNRMITTLSFHSRHLPLTYLQINDPIRKSSMCSLGHQTPSCIFRSTYNQKVICPKSLLPYWFFLLMWSCMYSNEPFKSRWWRYKCHIYINIVVIPDVSIFSIAVIFSVVEWVGCTPPEKMLMLRKLFHDKWCYFWMSWKACHRKCQDYVYIKCEYCCTM